MIEKCIFLRFMMIRELKPFTSGKFKRSGNYYYSKRKTVFVTDFTPKIGGGPLLFEFRDI